MDDEKSELCPKHVLVDTWNSAMRQAMLIDDLYKQLYDEDIPDAEWSEGNSETEEAESNPEPVTKSTLVH